MPVKLPQIIADWVAEQTDSNLVDCEAISGGCINQAVKITLQNNTNLFVKYNLSAPDLMFYTEAAGLEAINQQVNFFAPKVIGFSDKAIMLEYLPAVSGCKSHWLQLGKSLAQLHQGRFKQFGFESDNFCGLTPQINSVNENGFEYFAENRINYLARLVFNKGLISKQLLTQIDYLAINLARWIPQMPPVLIHGDLWSGNVMATDTGCKIVDPACYYGWAEAELAMTCLFGGFDQTFYQAYQAHSHVDKDWRERIPLYNLYHLLNHVNLFGGSYLSQVEGIVRRFV